MLMRKVSEKVVSSLGRYKSSNQSKVDGGGEVLSFEVLSTSFESSSLSWAMAEPEWNVIHVICAQLWYHFF